MNNKICIDGMKKLKEEYIQLVKNEKVLGDNWEKTCEKHGYNNRKKEVVNSLNELRVNQFLQNKTLTDIGKLFVTIYK